MCVQKSPVVKTVLILLVTDSLVRNCVTFDLVSSILSQGPNFPLEQLKSLVSPETLQKFLESKGLLSSAETLRNGDPSQIQSLLSRLKPMQGGRVDPRILELLTSTLGGTNSVPPSAHPQAPPPARTKFSSKFRRRRPGKSRTSPMPPSILADDVNESPDGTLQFDRIDPNIRNHNTYGWRSQNFTTIDRNEDLMMDEAESQPSLIPLSSDSAEIERSSATKSGHWEPPHPQSTEEPPGDFESHFTREPLRKASSDIMPSGPHFGPTASTPPHFRPSPVDSQGPLRILKNRERYPNNRDLDREEFSFLNRIGQLPPNSRRPPPPVHIPPLYSGEKQKRILNVDHTDNHWDSEPPGRQVPIPNLAVTVQGHAPPAVTGLAVPSAGVHGAQGHESKVNYQYAKPAYYPGKDYKGYPQHPFSHYKERNSMYSPSHYHHNKYHYLNPMLESDQSPASDKVDGYWSSSTFFILGGIVAASALAAFVLPSFIPAAAAAGKENEVPTATEVNADFWDEVKGLYTDLAHLAKGDLMHFDNRLGHQQMKKKKDSILYDTHEPTYEPELLRRPETTESSSMESSESTGSDRRKPNRRGSGRIDNEEDETASLATPIFHQIASASSAFGSPSQFGSYRPNNSSVMKEWVKLQLQVSE